MNSRNIVKVVQHSDIVKLNISPKECVAWVEESFRMKYEAQLPPKISLHPQSDDFFNTMPCILPEHFHRFGVKVVHRIAGKEPALGSDILLYDSQTGELLTIMDGDWITTMRTGAVAALAVKTFKKEGVSTYSFMGLGNTARATALCIADGNRERRLTFRLLRYKNQAESFIERFKSYPNISFEIIDKIEDFIGEADVIVSCITSASGIICPDDALFKEGVLVVPVHTRGFQNCDLFFDKVFGDDAGHLHGFKYFSHFQKFEEFSKVLMGKTLGRENNNERILAYNIGLGLHDIVFANKIYSMLENGNCNYILQVKEKRKFWI